MQTATLSDDALALLHLHYSGRYLSMHGANRNRFRAARRRKRGSPIASWWTQG